MVDARPFGTTPSRRGSLILGITGGACVLLTAASGLLRWMYPDALWSEVFFALSISGLVGFATNWVAIKMLFHPRVRVWGVQGVVPARRRELARSVGETLEAKLISGERMHTLLVQTGAVDKALDRLTGALPGLLQHPDARNAVAREVEATIQDTMADMVMAAKDKLREKSRSNLTALVTGAAAATTFGPVVGLLAAGITRSGVFDTLVAKLIDDMAADLRRDGGLAGAAAGIVDQLPARAQALLGNADFRARLAGQFDDVAQQLIRSIDVASLIENELLGRDEGELEELIDNVASNELVFIQVSGGFLGVVAGLALVWPWMLAPIGAVFVAMMLVARHAEKRHLKAQSAPKPAAKPPQVQPAPQPAEPVRQPEPIA